jgi:hypothetical protein
VPAPTVPSLESTRMYCWHVPAASCLSTAVFSIREDGLEKDATWVQHCNIACASGNGTVGICTIRPSTFVDWECEAEAEAEVVALVKTSADFSSPSHVLACWRVGECDSHALAPSNSANRVDLV